MFLFVYQIFVIKDNAKLVGGLAILGETIMLTKFY